MTVTSVTKDVSARTLTITAEFSAPIARVWQLWDDPRRLERWWGPPTYPATMVEHDLQPGGRVTYFMTGPEGDQHHGWWRVIAVRPPAHLEFEDGFADANGTPNPEMPTNLTHVAIDEHSAGTTRMTIVSTFPSEEAMTRLIEMGMEEGMRQAMGQMDAVVAEGASA
jgi:uncharacterized protein YndB with AHSA1/START domain